MDETTQYDKLHFEMMIATVRELIADIEQDIPDLTGDHLLTAQGRLADYREHLRTFTEHLDRVLYWPEAIWAIRKAILSFELKPTHIRLVVTDPQKDECFELRTDSKFIIERIIKAVQTLTNCYRTEPEPMPDDMIRMYVQLSKVILKEIRDIPAPKKPRKKRR